MSVIRKRAAPFAAYDVSDQVEVELLILCPDIAVFLCPSCHCRQFALYSRVYCAEDSCLSSSNCWCQSRLRSSSSSRVGAAEQVPQRVGRLRACGQHSAERYWLPATKSKECFNKVASVVKDILVQAAVPVDSVNDGKEQDGTSAGGALPLQTLARTSFQQASQSR